jgi:hypothetical protein
VVAEPPHGRLDIVQLRGEYSLAAQAIVDARNNKSRIDQPGEERNRLAREPGEVSTMIHDPRPAVQVHDERRILLPFGRVDIKSKGAESGRPRIDHVAVDPNLCHGAPLHASWLVNYRGPGAAADESGNTCNRDGECTRTASR